VDEEQLDLFEERDQVGHGEGVEDLAIKYIPGDLSSDIVNIKRLN
jgi:hypothetical protein